MQVANPLSHTHSRGEPPLLLSPLLPFPCYRLSGGDLHVVNQRAKEGGGSEGGRRRTLSCSCHPWFPVDEVEKRKRSTCLLALAQVQHCLDSHAASQK